MDNPQTNKVTSNSEISEDAMENQQISNAVNNSQRPLLGIEEGFKQPPLSSEAGGTPVFRYRPYQPQRGNNNRGLKDFLRDVSKCCLR